MFLFFPTPSVALGIVAALQIGFAADLWAELPRYPLAGECIVTPWGSCPSQGGAAHLVGFSRGVSPVTGAGPGLCPKRNPAQLEFTELGCIQHKRIGRATWLKHTVRMPPVCYSLIIDHLFLTGSQFNLLASWKAIAMHLRQRCVV